MHLWFYTTPAPSDFSRTQQAQPTPPQVLANGAIDQSRKPLTN
jgi:hypothetical protein